MEHESPSFEGFIAFLQKAPATVVDHDGGWRACAFGDYLIDGCGLAPNLIFGCIAREVLPASAFELLNEGGRIGKGFLAKFYDVATYSDIVEAFKSLYPEMFD